MTKRKVKPRAYYAHSMHIYNSPREKKELAYLRRRFNVLCPNNDIGHITPFSKYLRISAWADVVVVSEYKGYVGRGVYEEVEQALKLKQTVYCIRENDTGLILLPVKQVEIHNSGDWKRNYGRIILA